LLNGVTTIVPIELRRAIAPRSTVQILECRTNRARTAPCSRTVAPYPPPTRPARLPCTRVAMAALRTFRIVLGIDFARSLVGHSRRSDDVRRRSAKPVILDLRERRALCRCGQPVRQFCIKSGNRTMPSWSLPDECTTRIVHGLPLSLRGACGISAAMKHCSPWLTRMCFCRLSP
jgi:hypothetical protein